MFGAPARWKRTDETLPAGARVAPRMQIDAARRAMRMTSSMSCSTSRAAHLSASRSRRRRDGRAVVARASREATRSASPDDVDNTEGDGSSLGTSGRCTRRGALRAALGAGALALATTTSPDLAVAAADPANPRSYFQRYPTLFAPFYGDDERVTLLKTVVPDQVWALEQNLAIGPLETPLRCVVIRLEDGSLWVHAPLAPTAEFFALVESIGGPVRHVVVPTYALEHKIFARDALERWPAADLWVAPGQFSFPVEVSAAEVYGREPRGVLGRAEDGGSGETPPWLSEIDCEVLRAGKFGVAWKDVTIREATFFHARSKTLVVTDAVARVPYEIPPLQTPEKLLLVGKRSTADPQPPDTPENRLAGWKKMALLVNYFFPEHEEPAPGQLGVVEWTPGWEENFDALAGRLLVPPVVRSLLYSQDPRAVRAYVDRVTAKWDFERVVPAHWEGPIDAGPNEFRDAFRFLEDPSLDPFPKADMARGLQPIADLVVAPADA